MEGGEGQRVCALRPRLESRPTALVYPIAALGDLWILVVKNQFFESKLQAVREHEHLAGAADAYERRHPNAS